MYSVSPAPVHGSLLTAAGRHFAHVSKCDHAPPGANQCAGGDLRPPLQSPVSAAAAPAGPWAAQEPLSPGQSAQTEVRQLPPAPYGRQTAEVGGRAHWLRGLQEDSHRLRFGPWLLEQQGEAALLTPLARWPGTRLASSRQARPGGQANGRRGMLELFIAASLQRARSTGSC